MLISYVLIAVSCFTGGLLGNTNKDCGLGHYYDPNTSDCHPCSECSGGRIGNIYCDRECKGEAIDMESVSVTWRRDRLWFLCRMRKNVNPQVFTILKTTAQNFGVKFCALVVCSGHVTVRAGCEISRYYDPNTGRCHPCSECEPPRTSNPYCRAQCKGLLYLSL